MQKVFFVVVAGKTNGAERNHLHNNAVDLIYQFMQVF